MGRLFADPSCCFDEFVGVKHANMPWDYKPKDLDRCPYPFDVPALEVLQAQFRVMPHSASFESSKIFTEVI